MGNDNKTFLTIVDTETKAAILASIADRYGITAEEAFAEVAGAHAEHLLDYLAEPQRSATSVLMQRHGIAGAPA